MNDELAIGTKVQLPSGEIGVVVRPLIRVEIRDASDRTTKYVDWPADQVRAVPQETELERARREWAGWDVSRMNSYSNAVHDALIAAEREDAAREEREAWRAGWHNNYAKSPPNCRCWACNFARKREGVPS